MTRNLFYSAVASGSAVLMLALLALAGRTLGVDDYGAFTYAITLATIAEVFMDFGLHQITIRAVARDPSSAARLFRTSLALKLLPGIGMVLIFGVATFVLRTEPDVRLACLLMLAGAAMRSLVLTTRGILQGLERFGADAFVTTADRVLLLVACGVALLGGAGLVGTSLVFLLVRVATAVGSLLFVARIVGHASGVDRDLWRRLPREALPVGTFLLVLNLYNRVDTLMLGSLSGFYETGLYGAAYPLYEGLTYATAILSAVLVPRLSRLWAGDRVAYARLARRALAASAVMAVALTAVALPLAERGVTLFGAEYREAASTLRLLALALPFIYVLWGLHAVAISSHHTRPLVVVTAIGTVVNVTLNALWIPAHGADGAAAATVISEILAAGLLTWSLRGALTGSRPAPPHPAATSE